MNIGFIMYGNIYLFYYNNIEVDYEQFKYF